MRASLLLVLLLCMELAAVAANPLRIQSEKVEISVYGLKPEFINFNWKVEIVYEILDPTDLGLLENYAVPQPIDPTFKASGPEQWHSFFFIEEVKIQNFDIEKKGANGSWSKLKSKMNVTRPPFFNPLKMRYDEPIMTAYQTDMEGLKKGDLVRVTYEWDAPFLSNPMELWSIRLFQHGTLAKEDYQLTITYPNDLQWSLQYFNHAEPDQVRPAPNNRMEETWNRRDLPGCLLETNSRPYLELPYILLSFTKVDLGSILGSQVPGFTGSLDVPVNYMFTTTRTTDYFDDIGGISTGIASRNRRTINGLLEKETTESQTPLEKMLKLHEVIEREYSYDPSVKIYERPGLRDLSVSDQIADKTLEDVMRHRLYLTLFYWTKTTVFLGFSMDKRSGVISENYSRPFAQNDYFFAASDTEGNISLFSPKTGQRGLNINEFPFYLQGTEAMLMFNLDRKYFTVKDSEITVGKFIAINIPANAASENVRMWNGRITAYTAGDAVTTEGRLTLSGQYSTLTRGVYQSNSVLDDAPAYYAKPVWKGSIGNFPANVTEVSSSSARPYSAIYNISYSSTMTNGSLEIGQWLSHLLPEPLDTGARELTYYADFLGSDIVNFQVILKGISTELELPEEVIVENDFGSYHFSAFQAGPGLVNVVSQFTIQKEAVEAGNVDQVRALLDAAYAARAATIRWETE